jgi:hypothetical protein
VAVEAATTVRAGGDVGLAASCVNFKGLAFFCVVVVVVVVVVVAAAAAAV